jgi:hypothetical protein
MRSNFRAPTRVGQHLGFNWNRPARACWAACCAALLVATAVPVFAQETDRSADTDFRPKRVAIAIFVLDLFSMNSVDQTTSIDVIVRIQ